MAGYSKRPLAAKLGLGPGKRVFLLAAPESVLEEIGPALSECQQARRLGREHDYIQIFTSSAAELERRLPALVAALARDGMLWVSWPKQASGVATDLDENRVRALGLGAGLVDVKVCAVDDVWSGLKFVYRLVDRRR